jgi:protocatechuate 3,4-dioxygenase beta subunit
MNTRALVFSFHAHPVFAGTALAVLAALSSGAATPTAEVTEGPYYPFNARNTLPVIEPSNRDNDLTRVVGARQPAQGMPFLLSGVVRDAAGEPLAGLKVELWQTDDSGVYYHSGDSRVTKRDPNFQFYGESVTARDGAYSFRTIKPGLYGERVRHFHFKVKRGDATLLTSQFTFDDERGDFAKDGVQRRLSGEALESTVIAPTRGTDSQGTPALIATKDIIVDAGGASTNSASPKGKRSKREE